MDGSTCELATCAPPAAIAETPATLPTDAVGIEVPNRDWKRSMTRESSQSSLP